MREQRQRAVLARAYRTRLKGNSRKVALRHSPRLNFRGGADRGDNVAGVASSGSYVAVDVRPDALLKVLEWLGWNNPAGRGTRRARAESAPRC